MRLEPLYYLFIYNTYVLNRVYTATSTATSTPMMKAPTFILIYIYFIYFILFKWCISKYNEVESAGLRRTLWGSVKYWEEARFLDPLDWFWWGMDSCCCLPDDFVPRTLPQSEDFPRPLRWFIFVEYVTCFPQTHVQGIHGAITRDRLEKLRESDGIAQSLWTLI